LLVFHYRWLLDDAFIYFRYVDNLLFLDAGLVFNAGEYVEGFSSPLHCLVLIALRALHLDWMHAITLLGLASFAAFAGLLIRLNRELSPEGVTFDLPLALLATCYGTASFFTSGLETPLAQLVAPAVGLYLLRPRGFALTALVAAAPLVRPELALALAASFGFCWWRDARFPLRLFVLAALLNGAWLLFRIVYYADLLPNTFYLKDDVQWAQGLTYLWDLLRTTWLPAIALALAGLWGAARRRGLAPECQAPSARVAMLLLALAVAAYVVRIGGAALHYWYLAFPFTLLVCAASGLVETAAARAGLRGSRGLPAAALALAGFVALQYPAQLSAHPFWRSEEHVQIGVIGDASYHRRHPTLRPGSWRDRVRIEDMLDFAPTLASAGYDDVVTGTWCRTHWAQYRSRVVHGFGLTEPVLARVDTPELKPGHKPALRPLAEDLARRRRGSAETPAWIADNRRTIETIERKLHNRHDFFENLALAFSFPARIELPAAPDPSAASGLGPPSVVIVTLDTTRVDHLPDYGYERDITPNLSALARESVRFERAWSTSSWTLPAHASLFTGLFPTSHGARADPKGRLNLDQVTDVNFGRLSSVRGLHASQVTLAEILAEHGYHTGAFVGGPWLRRLFGLLQGFDRADDEVQHVHGRRADEVTDRAIAWLEAVPEDEPFFLFANYFDPHAPFDPPAGFDDLPKASDPFDPAPHTKALLQGRRQLSDHEREVLIDRYDGEIRFADHHLGRLLDAVARRPDGDRALVIITADHGEAFGEGGRYQHTFWLSEELLRVPLLVRYPDRRGAGTEEDAPVQLVDVLPLVAKELGLGLPEPVEGVLPGHRRRAFARVYPQRLGALVAPGKLGNAREAVIEWPYKLVRVGATPPNLYRVDRWPQELAENPDITAKLSRHLAEAGRSRRPGPVETPELDAETERMLRELGYLE
jgi:arylsulfatase